VDSASSSVRRRSIVLHSSWRGQITALLGPVSLMLLGGYGIALSGVGVINGILAGIGIVLMIVVLIDFPLRTTFSSAGVDRRCLFRNEHIEWSRVRAIVRPAGKRTFGYTRSSRTGLVAEVGKRPYLLVDRLESQPEHEALERAVSDWAPGLIFRASKPADGTAPTWLYKFRKGSGAESPLVDEL